MSDASFKFVSRKKIGICICRCLLTSGNFKRDFCVGYTMLLYIHGMRAAFFRFVGEGIRLMGAGLASLN